MKQSIKSMRPHSREDRARRIAEGEFVFVPWGQRVNKRSRPLGGMKTLSLRTAMTAITDPWRPDELRFSVDDLAWAARLPPPPADDEP